MGRQTVIGHRWAVGIPTVTYLRCRGAYGIDQPTPPTAFANLRISKARSATLASRRLRHPPACGFGTDRECRDVQRQLSVRLRVEHGRHLCAEPAVTDF